MFNIIAFLILIISIAAILIIIYKKLPILSQIKPEEIEKEKRTKYNLLENRLKRKIEGIFTKIELNQVFDKIMRMRGSFKNLSQFIRKKKNEYAHSIKIKKLEESGIADPKAQETDSLAQIRTLIKEEKFKEAESAMFNIIKNDPKSLETYRSLGYLYKENKDWLHAEATFEHVISLADRLKQLKAHDYIEFAEVKLHLEKMSDALQNARKAISLEPLNPKILHFLVTTSIKCKEKELGWKYFRILKKINGDNNGTGELLDELKKI